MNAMSSDVAIVANDVDPAAEFDNLLSKELLQLSVNDRNNLQEEIHGVRCLAPDETSQLIEESLRKLATELDENIPDYQKEAYLRSQRRPASAAFVNSQNFRLRFLRCELFDHRKAAERMVRVCDCLLKLFGMYALERPIRISDFSNAELKAIRRGRLQLLPFRDRSGRRIAILFPGVECLKENANENDGAVVRTLQLKTFIYMSYILGSEVDTQRRGIVFLVWFDDKMQSSASPDVNRIKMGIKSHSMALLRASAIHICSPDTPFYRLQRSVLAMGAGHNRQKLRLHVGEFHKM
jgi:hypothetical protein